MIESMRFPRGASAESNEVPTVNYPYIGDRQLEPDDCDCPYCGAPFSGPATLMRHVERCPLNNDLDPEPEAEEV